MGTEPITPRENPQMELMNEIVKDLVKDQKRFFARYPPEYDREVIRMLHEINMTLNNIVETELPYEPREHSRDALIAIVETLKIKLKRCDDLIGDALERMER